MNLSVQIRIGPMKKVTRKLRELKSDYYYFRNRFFNFNTRETVSEHLELFVDSYSKEFDNEYSLIKWSVSSHRKKLHPDWQVFIASVYMGICVYKALIEYSKEADMAIEKLWGESRHSIIPDVINQSYFLLKEYLGDCQVLSEDDIKSSSNRILNMIKSIEFNV